MEKPQVKLNKMSSYSSNLNDAEWAVVEALLNDLLPKKKQTCPQKWSYRILFNAMLYQLKNGCDWAELPKDFPPYSSVYWHYKQWRAHESLREQKR